jgi:hypothetical protein
MEMACDADLQDVYDTERHLLYVACTRARDHLLVTSVEPASEKAASPQRNQNSCINHRWFGCFTNGIILSDEAIILAISCVNLIPSFIGVTDSLISTRVCMQRGGWVEH